MSKDQENKVQELVQAMMADLADRGAYQAPPLPEPGGCPRCAARWPRPGECDWCAARMPPAPAGSEEIWARARAIPPAFRGVTWANVGSLRNDADQLRVRLGQGAIFRVRAELGSKRRAVLLGPPGAGKSTLAGAYARAAIEAGVERVRWFTALELLENRARESSSPTGSTVLPVDLAESADVLVLDDLGSELEAAQRGSGLLAQRIGACSRVVASRFDRRLPTLVTTGFEPEALGELYGDRIKRRLFEGAAVVRLG